jgi:hypothetical protein
MDGWMDGWRRTGFKKKQKLRSGGQLPGIESRGGRFLREAEAHSGQ